jgi:hypothetical protein
VCKGIAEASIHVKMNPMTLTVDMTLAKLAAGEDESERLANAVVGTVACQLKPHYHQIEFPRSTHKKILRSIASFTGPLPSRGLRQRGVAALPLELREMIMLVSFTRSR